MSDQFRPCGCPTNGEHRAWCHVGARPPSTVEEHTDRIFKQMSYGFGHGMSRSRILAGMMEYLEQHFHLASECKEKV